MLLADKVISLPEIYPSWFKPSALSIVRTALIFLFIFCLFFFCLTLPELLWDQQKNYKYYKDQIKEYENKFVKDTNENVEIKLEDRRSWFSERMWDYRFLIYTVHVRERYENPTEHDRKLASWQSEKLLSSPSPFWMHYLNNPGFYWDIAFLMPLSLSTLVMALYFMIMHLNKYKSATEEGRRPYIPENTSRQLISFLLEPYTLMSCLLAGAAITAGNHGTGFLSLDSQNYTRFSVFMFRLMEWISYLGAVPIIAIAFYGARQIYRIVQKDSFSIETDQADSIGSHLGFLKIILWISLISSIVSLVFALIPDQGWVEKITNLELSPVKPVQRFLRYFFLTLGVYAALWIAILIIGRARVSVAVNAMLKKTDVEIEERISVFNDLVENEIYVLEYFGIFLTITIMSYFQSAVFIWKDADIQTSVGIALLTGVILISLVMFILPVIYTWYIIVDSKRFDKWADSVISGKYLSEKDEQILIRKQKSRLTQVVMIIIKRYKILNPILTISGALFFAGGFTGLLSGIFNW